METPRVYTLFAGPVQPRIAPGPGWWRATKAHTILMPAARPEPMPARRAEAKFRPIPTERCWALRSCCTDLRRRRLRLLMLGRSWRNRLARRRGRERQRPARNFVTVHDDYSPMPSGQ